MAPARPRRSVPSGSSSFNAFGICNAIGKYWQKPPPMARSMFAQSRDYQWAREIIGVKLASIGFSDRQGSVLIALMPAAFSIRAAQPPSVDVNPVRQPRLIWLRAAGCCKGMP